MIDILKQAYTRYPDCLTVPVVTSEGQYLRVSMNMVNVPYRASSASDKYDSMSSDTWAIGRGFEVPQRAAAIWNIPHLNCSVHGISRTPC